MGILKTLADNRQAASLANRFRRRRGRWLAKVISDLAPSKNNGHEARPVHILDVGGTEDFWLRSDLTRLPIDVTLVNVAPEDVTLPNFRSKVGDARDLSEFHDGEFDLVVSNSVIEHVGEWSEQQRMADAVRRVGRNYFVQTPARYFPVEPHLLFPGFTYLPPSAREWLVCHLALGWYPKQPNRQAAREFLRNFNLLTRSQMEALFPRCVIVTERVGFLPKSYVALGGDDIPVSR